MKHLSSDSERALYIWDYFYLANVPARGDEAAWGKIERATHRIRESEPYLDASKFSQWFRPAPSADERLRHARRVRNAVRLALRQIALLSTITETWVVDGLRRLDAAATTAIDELVKPRGSIH